MPFPQDTMARLHVFPSLDWESRARKAQASVTRVTAELPVLLDSRFHGNDNVSRLWESPPKTGDVTVVASMTKGKTIRAAPSPITYNPSPEAIHIPIRARRHYLALAVTVYVGEYGLAGNCIHRLDPLYVRLRSRRRIPSEAIQRALFGAE
jgi:hypothetical protein